ncbi:DNA-directed RNA polymerase complex I subunit Rpa12 [Schizosaccharomyces japonicus yFS275]|uniref:DNA-directed RNA polymerase subunit n=1 Tax=Schizosaccharomyces japonicus (strain yFS275 / FY16936) TaxID=402676 RepID=B6K5Y0_SCHJY|nr:DNA-directed RNA polymerase complex I subunit Rpa12 [Schizosaccharomyces japonicus yFS275]EEB08934.1 DNA-directed RNA polymerase complex I subunit Rpa12 [Schizosaccharomyces japonicus yFS275]
MSAIGSLIFCSACGNLLESTTAQWTICDQCQSSYPSEKFAHLTLETRSGANAFPSALRLKHSIVQTEGKKPEEAAVIQEKCPKCGNDEMTFHTLQLRSADEGSTVFYECPRCAYKFSTNN